MFAEEQDMQWEHTTRRPVNSATIIGAVLSMLRPTDG